MSAEVCAARRTPTAATGGTAAMTKSAGSGQKWAAACLAMHYAAPAECESERLYRVRCTLLQMLRDRGYDVDQSLMDATLDEFREQYGDVPDRTQMSMLFRRPTHSPDQGDSPILVAFATETKVGVKPIRDLCARMHDESIPRVIYVLMDSVTPFAKSALRSSRFHVEEFREIDLMTNITRHERVPPHTVLTEQEKTALLAHLKCKDSQLPRLPVYDPVARYYGLKVRQVVRIVRRSETAGQCTIYRVVVP